MEIELTDEALEAAELYVHGAGEWEYDKALNVREEGRVGEIKLRAETPLRIAARIGGRRGYDVALQYDEVWSGHCSCPMGADCKHCRAVVLELLDMYETFEDADEPAPAPPPPAAKAKGGASPAKSEFVAGIEKKVQRALSASELRLLRLIEEAHARHANTKDVPESAIAELWGPPQPWSWQRHTLWPAPPESPWEAWLYLLHFIRQQKKKPPEFLARITPDEEVAALIGPWQWRSEVQSWKAELELAARGPADPTAATVELRLVVRPNAATLESRRTGKGWEEMKRGEFNGYINRYNATAELTPAAAALWSAIIMRTPGQPELRYDSSATASTVAALIRNPLYAELVVTDAGVPFRREEQPLKWISTPAENEGDYYTFDLAKDNGERPEEAILMADGQPSLYVTCDTIYKVPPLGRLSLSQGLRARIPAPAMESSAGVTLLESAAVPLPERIARRVVRYAPRLIVEAKVERNSYYVDESLKVTITAEWPPTPRRAQFSGAQWLTTRESKSAADAGVIETFERGALDEAAGMVAQLKLNVANDAWVRRITRKFPEEFGEWLATLPPGTELRLDKLLASLRDDPLKAKVQLDAEPAGVDWFDLTVALDLGDLELTPEELQALLNAKGGWVRLGEKGWRRLAVQLSGEEDVALADLGLSARDLAGGEKQRLHALQLASAGADRLLPQRTVEELRARARELKAQVSPPVPAAITAELRPYQVEGFHFLAYLSTNRFGGLLADDMGLGKTVQTLTWLTWLREQPGETPRASIVVCPKSVMDNWESEARRFAPHLRVKRWAMRAGATLAETAREHDLLVLNYAQLRLLEDELGKIDWLAAILDEAQGIKNPDSQTTQVARALRASHRLALTGTPIENRLLDLWSIMSFTMPGMLGARANFARTYDQKDDPLARRRLAARTRPFLIRRTKEQVARDLPERIEEELLCEMEGRQATLYRAELKRARQALLKIKTARELDGARFHILTSLLRLRQICCHPGLVEEESLSKPSAKLDALLELLEPLIEEGRKVLVFSQFVGVLEILQRAIRAKGWPQFILTGQTEDRGELIAEFQRTEGAAVFLLSLKASGFGLNLTAASYVVLYDPWWNPAVENQAIDRTHRIGQTSTVFAYRLLVKGTIEEKIRGLQKHKRALAEDILGEESFARALTLDDLHALLAD